ncbi:MAG TPA: HNH endonuclease signature motif containing protein [Methanolinea sp.]|nr:HNH endonuclease signature motif containing protein [Methanolinea sp.]
MSGASEHGRHHGPRTPRRAAPRCERRFPGAPDGEEERTGDRSEHGGCVGIKDRFCIRYLSVILSYFKSDISTKTNYYFDEKMNKIKIIPNKAIFERRFLEFKKKFSFTSFSKGTAYEEEGYKRDIFVIGQDRLNFKNWDYQMVGTGEIIQRVIDACEIDVKNYRGFSKIHNNIVTWESGRENKRTNRVLYTAQKDQVLRRNLELVLYNFYTDRVTDEETFKRLMDFPDINYNLISYLFFLKNFGKYAPIRTRNFDKAFKVLGIPFTTVGQCSWENYRTYNNLLREIQSLLQEKCDDAVDLIDAHSFCWMIRNLYEKDKTASENQKIKADDLKKTIHDGASSPVNIKEFEEILKKEEEEAQSLSYRQLQKKSEESPDYPPKVIVTSTAFLRSSYIANFVKRRANGICQLCNNPAPFNNKNGQPYLESHHIDWLSEGGIDKIENSVALCPNCHAKMHILNLEKDKKRLKRIALIKK